MKDLEIRTDEIQDVPTAPLIVTETAVAKIKSLLAERELPNHALRVFVAGGGCSGLQYGMAFEGNPRETDTLIEIEGVKLVVDEISLPYIYGANIDFVDNLMGGGFRIENPNAASSCGCGTSFKPKNEDGTQAASGGGCSTCG
ncbi:MAG: iron-sulfur cluster insertion protein ErpA [Chloroflexi bacterium]|nr:iron-sulfur cluster insertion protein ErpA [Chloroflexota bacterium]